MGMENEGRGREGGRGRQSRGLESGLKKGVSFDQGELQREAAPGGALLIAGAGGV